VVVRPIEKITIGKHKCDYKKGIAGVRLNRLTLLSEILQRKFFHWQGIQISTVEKQIDP
jgi:hypothetical protein